MTYWPCEDAPEIAEAKRLMWLSHHAGILPLQLMEMDAAELERIWRWLPAIDRDAHMQRESKRILRTLPLRVRLRLTSAGDWLLDHGWVQATVWLWRLTGLWH